MCLGNLMAQVIAYIIYLSYSHQNGCYFQQLLIFHVINERPDGYCIFWLKDIGVRGVVNDDSGGQVSAETL